MFHVEHFARPRNPQPDCDFCVGNPAVGIPRAVEGAQVRVRSLHPNLGGAGKTLCAPSADCVWKLGWLTNRMFHVEHFARRSCQQTLSLIRRAPGRPSQVRVQRTHPNLGHLRVTMFESCIGLRTKCSTWNILRAWDCPEIGWLQVHELVAGKPDSSELKPFG